MLLYINTLKLLKAITNSKNLHSVYYTKSQAQT